MCSATAVHAPDLKRLLQDGVPGDAWGRLEFEDPEIAWVMECACEVAITMECAAYTALRTIFPGGCHGATLVSMVLHQHLLRSAFGLASDSNSLIPTFLSKPADDKITGLLSVHL